MNKIGENYVVFITGGCSGLGLATVELLHSAGAKICVADRDEIQLEEMAKRFTQNLICATCDVSEES